MPVSLANSVGSCSLLSRRSSRSRDRSRSTPAMDTSRFPRRFSALIAGNGFLLSECRDSIMQLLRFRALKDVKILRASGISTIKLEDKSNESKLLERGARLEDVIEVRELSARLKCLRNLHFDAGSIPMGAGPREWVLEVELPDPERLTLTCLEVLGLLGDALFVPGLRRWDTEISGSC